MSTPRSTKQVAIREDEATRSRFKRIHCRISIGDCLQAVRPVNRRCNTSVEAFDCGQEISGINVLRTENLAPVQIIELEIVRERPVSTEPTKCGLPHVAMGVNHPRHEDTIRCVDLYCAIRHDELSSHSRNAVGYNEDIASLYHPKRRVNGQHRGVAEHHRTTWCKAITVCC